MINFILKNKYFHLYLLFIFISCQRLVTPDNNHKIFISEPLLNRANYIPDKHDSECSGYYHTHFSPSLIDTSDFESNTLSLLKKKTGIDWNSFSINDTLFDICKMVKEDKNRVVYIAEQIEADSAETKILCLGSDDGFVLWLNGDSLAGTHSGRVVFPYDDLVPVKLRKGKNILLYKVEQSTEAWKLFRKLIPLEKLESVLTFIMPNLYGDVPESCILPDNMTYIQIKENKNHQLDNFHTVQLCWKDLGIRNKYIKTESFPAANLPETFALPDKFSGKVLFEIKVIDSHKKIVFREEIPIFINSEAEKLASQLTESSKFTEDPVLIARRDAVLELFKLGKYKGNTTAYSTRMQAHSLLDLYRSVIHSVHSNQAFTGPQVWGYRSKKDDSIQTYRVFKPAGLSEKKDREKKYPVVFIFRYLQEKDQDFWQTRHGMSHSNMITRMGISTQCRMILVMPHGRGIQNYLGDAVEEIPLILDQMKTYLPVDTTDISFFCLSSGSMPAINLMQIHQLPITHLGLRSPSLSDDDDLIKQILSRLKNNYPSLWWYICHGRTYPKNPLRNRVFRTSSHSTYRLSY
jgi:hypothetical protein